MGLYKINTEKETLYSAYGITIEGTTGLYELSCCSDRPTEKVIVNIALIGADGKEIYNYIGGNNCIFMDCFNRTIDNICYYLNTEEGKTLDSYSLEKLITEKLYKNNNSLFNHSMENQKRKEKKETEEKKRIEEREKEEATVIDEMQAYCNKKKLFFYKDRFVVAVFKAHNEKAVEMLQKADGKQIEYIIGHCEKHTGNEADLVYKSDLWKPLEEILADIKEVA